MIRSSVIAVALLFTACGGTNKSPEAPLDRDRFEQVLMESLLIEARIAEEMRIDKRADIPAEAYYEEMFKMQGVTKVEFTTTYDAYLQKPEELRSVYQDVLKDLQHRADSAKTQ